MASDHNVKLSNREQIIFDLLRKERVATLERLTSIVSEHEGEKAKNNSVNNCVKLLMGKVTHMGYMIRRTSGIGRGQKATYRMAQIKLL
jgi:hypothetical protein